MLLEGDFKTKKKLVGVIGDVVEYLTDYKNRVQPLMSLKEIVDPALMGTVWQTVNEEWCPSDAADIDLSTIKSKADLEPFDLTTLTTALTSRGMKAGGTKVQKIDRLMHAVGVKDLSSIPAKHMAKASAATSADNASALFVLDFQCTALLKHYRPTLLQSVERNKRRRGQTVAEKLHERNEILTGTALEITEEESDEEEEIYNPKNLPLGWDGKPIAVWLYKLHGLNKYVCERSVRELCEPISLASTSHLRALAPGRMHCQLGDKRAFPTLARTSHSLALASSTRACITNVESRSHLVYSSG